MACRKAFARDGGPAGIPCNSPKRCASNCGTESSAFDNIMNTMINAPGNVFCTHVLVGSVQGSRMLPEPQEQPVLNLGSVSFATELTDPDNSSAFYLPVCQVTLDQLKLHRCDLIKIDVEG